MRCCKSRWVRWTVLAIAASATVGVVCSNANGEPPKQNVVSPEISSLIQRAESPDWRVRAAAARDLGLKREEAAPAVPALVRLLGEELSVSTDEVLPCFRAWEALERIGKPAVPGLIEALEQGSPEHRERAAAVLEGIGDARAVAPLIAALNDSNESVQDAAICALRTLADPRAVQPLSVLAKNRKQNDVCRRWAIRALGAFSTPEAIGVLAGILKDESERSFSRYNAAISLGTTRDHKAEEILLGMRHSPKKTVREGVYWGLGRTCNAQVVPLFIEAIKNFDEDVEVRRAAAIGLGRSMDATATHYLLSAVENQSIDQRVRSSIMASLAFTGDPAATSRLFTELKGGELSFAAAVGLRYLTDRRAVEQLLEALKSDNDTVRRFAAEALGNLKDRRAVEPLKALLKDHAGSVAAQALTALAKIEGPPWSRLDIDAFNPWAVMIEDGQAMLEIVGPE
jgi:HEAT repeat protein